MSRLTRNQYEMINSGRLINGYDYDKAAWVVDGQYVRCGHPPDMKCFCYGKAHEGEETKDKHCKSTLEGSYYCQLDAGHSEPHRNGLVRWEGETK